MAHTTYTTEWDDTITITHHTKGEDTIIEAHHDGERVSHLIAAPTGQIMWIETAEDHREEGIAAALLDHADTNGITLYHSPIEHCTEDGAAFAHATRMMLDEIDAA